MHGDCLLVEAEPVLAKNIRQYLQRYGYAVRTVASADGAWREVGCRRPDVVILDFEALGMAGIDLMARLIDCEPRVRIVLLSYQEDGQLALEALRLGAADLVAKPVSLDRLRRVVDLLTGKVQAPEDVRHEAPQKAPIALVWSRRDGG